MKIHNRNLVVAGCLLLIGVGALGCFKKSQSGSNPQSNEMTESRGEPSSPGEVQTDSANKPQDLKGAIDFSGAMLSRSEQSYFEKVFRDSWENASVALYRLSTVYFSRLYTYSDDEGMQPRTEFQGLVRILNPKIDGVHKDETLVRYKSENLAQILRPENRARVQATVENLKFHFQNVDCSSKDGHRDFAVNTKGEVCINVASVLRIPPSLLELELSAALAHEAVHVLIPGDDDEADAKAIQDSLLSLPQVTIHYSKKIRGFREALREEIYNSDSKVNMCSHFLSDSRNSGLIKWFCDMNSSSRLEKMLWEQEDEDLQSDWLFFSDYFYKVKQLYPRERELNDQITALCQQFRKEIEEDKLSAPTIVSFQNILQKFMKSQIDAQVTFEGFNREFESIAEPFSVEASTLSTTGITYPQITAFKNLNSRWRSGSPWANLHNRVHCEVKADLQKLAPESITSDGYSRVYSYVLPGEENPNIRLRIYLSSSARTQADKSIQYSTLVFGSVRVVEVRPSQFIYPEPVSERDELWQVKSNVNFAIGLNSASSFLEVHDIYENKILSGGAIEGFSFTFDRLVRKGLATPTLATQDLSVGCHLDGRPMPEVSSLLFENLMNF